MPRTPWRRSSPVGAMAMQLLLLVPGVVEAAIASAELGSCAASALAAEQTAELVDGEGAGSTALLQLAASWQGNGAAPLQVSAPQPQERLGRGAAALSQSHAAREHAKSADDDGSSEGAAVGVALAVTFVLLLLWFLTGCCGLIRRRGHAEELVAGQAATLPNCSERFCKQVAALSWKNAKMNSRTEVPGCRCCNACCAQMMVPIIFVALQTLVPTGIIEVKHMQDKVIVDQPSEYGRNYSDPGVWRARSHELLDYLFQEPSFLEVPSPAGSPQLWNPGMSGDVTVPAGACFCRTLGIVGPAADELATYLESRFLRWNREWARRAGPAAALADAPLREAACSAHNKAPIFRVFGREEEIDSWVSDFSYGVVDRQRNASSPLDRLCGAVLLESDPHNADVLRYTVRTNMTGFDIFGAAGSKGLSKGRQAMAALQKPLQWYMSSGFLAIQDLVQGFLAETRYGQQVELPSADFVPLPSKPFRLNMLTQAISGIIASPDNATPLFAANIMLISYFLIRERNTRQKELMRLMGLYDSSLALSWVLLFSAINFGVSLCCSALVYVTLVEHSSPIFLFLAFFLCNTAVTFLGMVVSTLISTERLGSLVAVGGFHMLGMVYYALVLDSGASSGGSPMSKDIPPFVPASRLVTAGLIPHIAFILTMKTYLDLDGSSLGCRLSRAFQFVGRFSVGGGLLLLLADCLLYALLYLYLDQVIQHDVGVARPWYFPVTAEFWRSVLGSQEAPEDPGPAAGGALAPSSQGDLFEVEDSEHLRQLQHRERVVSVQNLRKVYRDAAGMYVPAVDGLNLTMYEGECFCLLGHNGAGKSTTMGIITGMVPASSGEVKVFGRRMPEEALAVRREMGFCMQQNVLWDTLTVEEHVLLFGALMGLPSDSVDASCGRALEQVGLLLKRQVQAADLSGGMKRKLNVALALLGSPRIIMLDEPTAGMDPHTRRLLWGVLKQSRADRIMCLTTHHMDEADELGDRVCIMVQGRSACSGTNAFLKSRLGCGYLLNFVKTGESVRDAPIEAVVRQHCQGNVSVAAVVGRELRLRVPFSDAPAFPELMRALDTQLAQLGLESYGVGVSDLEDVFLRVADGGEPHVQSGGQAPAAKAAAKAAAATAAAAPTPTAAASQAAAAVAKPGSFALFWRQFLGLLQRRVRYGHRDSRMFFCQLLVPMLMMAAFFSLMQIFFDENFSFIFPKVPLDTFLDPHTLIEPLPPALLSVGVAGDGEDAARFAGAWRGAAPSGVAEVRLNTSLGLPDRSVAPSGPPPSADEQLQGAMKRMLGAGGPPAHGPGSREERLLREVSFADDAVAAANRESGRFAQFGGLLYTEGRVTVLPNASMKHAAPTLFNLHFSQLLASSSAQPKGLPVRAVEVSSKPLGGTAYEKGIAGIFNGFAMGMVVLGAYAFIPTGIAAYIVMEKEGDAKHQLMVSGTGHVAYWASNFIFDMVFGLFSAAATLVIMQLFGADQWLNGPNLQATLTLLLLFTPAASMSAYFWSFCFSTSGGALVGVLMLNMIVGTFGLEVASVLQLFEETKYGGNILLWSVRALLPTACLSRGLTQIAMWKDLSKFLNISPFAGYAFGTAFCTPLLPQDCIVNAGDDIFMLVVDTVLYGVLVLFMDMGGWPRLRHFLVRITHRCPRNGIACSRCGAGKCPPELRVAEDPCVVEEKERVSGLDPATQVLVVDDVYKSYGPSAHAVRGVTYAVERGEVFGLLGVNGAGKTTTFKMLCGQIEPSAGRVLVSNLDVSKELHAVQSRIGYCPQFNALLDLLTVREHLELYGQIKGMAGAKLVAEVEEKIGTFDLRRFEDTRACQLSGGNMRKLSCALAMTGEPPIVFLDEPSAGMDPVARRFMWEVIQSIASRRSGSAVVLTTHSMDEAGALCSRIAIQASGQLRCIGSPQQLKQWYSTGLELNVRLEVPQRPLVTALCAEWGCKTQQPLSVEEAGSLVAVRRAARAGQSPQAQGPHAVPHPDGAPASALAEWCLTREREAALSAFLRQHCGEASVSSSEQAAGSLRYHLEGSCPGGGPLPYSELFGLLQGAKDALSLADFQLSQGTLERTFNRFAAEDLLRATRAACPET